MSYHSLILLFLTSTLLCGCASARTRVVAASVTPAPGADSATVEAPNPDSLEERYAAAFRSHLRTTDLTAREPDSEPLRSNLLLRDIWRGAYRRAYEACGDLEVFLEEARSTHCYPFALARTPEARANVGGYLQGTDDGVQAGTSLLEPILEQWMEEEHARAEAVMRSEAGQPGPLPRR